MQSAGLSIVDMIIAVCYILSIVCIGLYFFKKQKSPKDFLLAGRNMSWFPVGLSLMATLTSAVGFMAFPAGAIRYGIIMLWMIAAIPLSYPVVAYVFIPFYQKLKVYTAYEYLEKRFNDRVRALASIIFILWRLSWMAAVIYVPSMVLNVVTDGAIPLIPSIIVLGIIATLNTSLGGIRAVMWADVVHSFMLFTSMIIAIFVIFKIVPGGISEVWGTLQEAGKTSMTGSILGFSDANFFGKIKLYLLADITVVSLIITYTVQKMGNYCVDQAMVQRYISAKSVEGSRKGFQTNAIAYMFYVVCVTTIGAGLFAVVSHFPFPETLQNDQIFPYYIANIMPIGITGIMIAAIYGASMSSIDSGINSCITAIFNDFYGRYKLKTYNLDSVEITEEENARRLKISRVSTLALGVLVTFLAMYVGKLGDIFIYSQRLINMFTGPLFGVFCLAMFTKRTTASGALIAGFLGFLLGSLMVFSKNLGIDFLAVGVLWPATISFLITVLLGYLLSFLIGKPKSDAEKYTWRSIMSESS
jgi:solute:Na+ symporter, SSS family